MLKPLSDRVVLRVEEEKEQTVGGFVLAGKAQEKPRVAAVVAVGPGKFDHGQRVEPSVKPGNKVVFEKFAGTVVKDGQDELLIVRESDILAVVE